MRSAVICFFLLLGLAVIAVPVASAQEAGPLVDSRGQEIHLAAPPQRIVSLAPSTSEIICAVGACDRIVATDGFSNYPAEVQSKPKLGSLRVGAESVLAQHPDLVITATITAPELISQLEALGVPVAIVGANSLDEVYASIALVGRLLGSDTYQQVVEDMRSRVERVTALAAQVTHRPTVYHELDEMLFSVGPGNFIDDLIFRAGGWNIMAQSPVPWPQVSAEYILVSDPEVIVLADAAYGVSPEAVAARPGWSDLSAVRNNAVYPIDPDIVSRPGPRLADALEEYARLLHPELMGQ